MKENQNEQENAPRKSIDKSNGKLIYLIDSFFYR